MPIVIPTYNGARKQSKPSRRCWLFCCRNSVFPVVVHGVSEDPTRVLTEVHSGIIRHRTHSPCWPGAGKLEGTSRSIFPCARSARRWKSSFWTCAGAWGYVTAPYTTAKLATPFAERRALRLSSVSPSGVRYAGRSILCREIGGGRALLMHGTEGEVLRQPAALLSTADAD